MHGFIDRTGIFLNEYTLDLAVQRRTLTQQAPELSALIADTYGPASAGLAAVGLHNPFEQMHGELEEAAGQFALLRFSQGFDLLNHGFPLNLMPGLLAQ
jgi:hypothetical protein